MKDMDKTKEQLMDELNSMRRQLTELKEKEKDLRHISTHDELTGLPNRIVFYEDLSYALMEAKKKQLMAALLFIDLDRFKLVNDIIGHMMGDQILKSIAFRLSRSIRRSDLIARIGGDEFGLILNGIMRIEDIPGIGQKITDSLREPVQVAGREFTITASIGIAVYPVHGDDADTLLKHADTAMYKAKEHGDNYQIYSAAMSEEDFELLATESALRKALENSEFVVHYQPQINTVTGEIIGVEALVRWQHPEKGIIPPAEFIPMAEETGLIIPLGEWVLRTACAQNKMWQAAGYPPMRVTVNLSARQFQQGNLVETVLGTLEETGLDPEWLELEITESIAMQDINYTMSVLNNLRNRNVRIAIDDFGTGYSSFSYLKNFPSHTLKIDRSFVKDVTTDNDDAAITKAIIALAQNLKLKVIAEGVETEEQLAFLKEQNCDQIQGYLFSRPVSAESFTELLKTRNISEKREECP
ncbi:MAG: hypothetical protein CVU89_15110 [Firmicutes bacterium HGW-Firmicutes-14]|nr:MAG: hypothetical protein CVU89_15110 [Firmicutes bacterium HGW-Firmicutes-14]